MRYLFSFNRVANTRLTKTALLAEHGTNPVAAMLIGISRPSRFNGYASPESPLTVSETVTSAHL